MNPRSRAEYSSDASNCRVVPKAIVFPRDTEDRPAVRIGIDIGGTFTDFVVAGDDGGAQRMEGRQHARRPLPVGFQKSAAPVNCDDGRGMVGQDDHPCHFACST